VASATLAKANPIATIANPKPIADKTSTGPTNFNANPIAKTATAINNIVPTPFLILLSFFLSVPVSSITFLDFSFCRAIIVF
jgi:hypothetical protein